MLNYTAMSSEVFGIEINPLLAESLCRTCVLHRGCGGKIELEFLGKEYSFSPFAPVLAGFFVAIVSSALGVGGGFLLVPFMVSVMGLLMFLVPGTSALSILITMLVSAGNYLKLGTRIDLQLLGIEIVGIVLGRMSRPVMSPFEAFSRRLGPYERKEYLLK